MAEPTARSSRSAHRQCKKLGWGEGLLWRNQPPPRPGALIGNAKNLDGARGFCDGTNRQVLQERSSAMLKNVVGAMGSVWRNQTIAPPGAFIGNAKILDRGAGLGYNALRPRPGLTARGRVAQLVRAPVLHTGSHRFKSCSAHQARLLRDFQVTFGRANLAVVVQFG